MAELTLEGAREVIEMIDRQIARTQPCDFRKSCLRFMLAQGLWKLPGGEEYIPEECRGMYAVECKSRKYSRSLRKERGA